MKDYFVCLKKWDNIKTARWFKKLLHVFTQPIHHECNKKSIFKQNIAGLNSEFSFS